MRLALEVPDGEHDAFDWPGGPGAADHPTGRGAGAGSARGHPLLRVWPEEAYTAEFVLGPQAGAYAAARYAAVDARYHAEVGFTDAFAHPAPGTVTELGAAFGPHTIPLDLP